MRQFTLSLVAVLGILFSMAVPAQAGATWKSVPLLKVDGSIVDIGFLYDEQCLTGPISVHVAYPADAEVRVLTEANGPDYVWSYDANRRLELTDEHIEIVVTATVPGNCNSDVGVQLTPISDRFLADEDIGFYDQRLRVRS